MPDEGEPGVVEKVARAIIVHMDVFSNMHASAPADAGWDDYSPLEQMKAIGAARAAIEALMEPTKDMVLAAEEAVYPRHERGFLVKPLIDPIDMHAAIAAALTKAGSQ